MEGVSDGTCGDAFKFEATAASVSRRHLVEQSRIPILMPGHNYCSSEGVCCALIPQAACAAFLSHNVVRASSV